MRATICGFALLLSLAPLAAPQDPEAQATSTLIIALEYAWNQAAEHKDTKALDALLDDSLAMIDPGGNFMSKAGYMAAVNAPALDTQLQVTESMTVAVYDHRAIFRYVFRNKGVNKGKPYSVRGRGADVWVNRKGRWVCVASQVTPISQ
jgi:ketosteroid isomerase-like protein